MGPSVEMAAKKEQSGAGILLRQTAYELGRKFIYIKETLGAFIYIILGMFRSSFWWWKSTRNPKKFVVYDSYVAARGVYGTGKFGNLKSPEPYQNSEILKIKSPVSIPN